jgi:ABC-2 type transport system ATP-binding protein
LIVLVDGQIVADGTTAAVIGRTSQDTLVRLRLPEGTVTPDGLELTPDPADPGVLLARTTDPTDLLHRLTGWAVASGVRFEDLSVARPSLEDTYLALTGHAQGDPGEPVEQPVGRRGRRR